MSLDRVAAAIPGAELIARDSLAAAQWEAALADRGAPESGRVWPSPPLSSFGGWLRDTWETARAPGAAGADERSLLSPAQSERLWQRVVEDSPEGDSLLSAAGVAAWARRARLSLHEHGQPPDAQGGDAWRGDCAAFLRWNARFEARLDEHGWLDSDSLLYRLNRTRLTPPARDLLWLDPPPAPPERRRLEARWRDAGRAVETLHPAGPPAATRALLAADPAAELELAADWAAQHFERTPASRLAVVVGDLEARRDEIERAFLDRLGPEQVGAERGRAIPAIGIFGAALTALRLLVPGTDFSGVSRWLRSPFFEGDEAGAPRAAFECRLRADPRAQLGFVAAYRRHGLRELLRRQLPDTARRLERALERLPRRATPTGWVQAWQAALAELGWRGFAAELPDALRHAWDDACAAFAALTPVTGTLDPVAALGELERVAGSHSIHQPLPPSGVHLVSRIARVGPGYAGAWITGFSDTGWPEPPAPNPLVPRPVQVALGMPEATPEAALAAADETLEHLCRRVPEAVFSCPERILDQPQVPNPRRDDWTRAGAAQSRGRPGYAGARLGARPRERVADAAPSFTGERLPGGARTLDLQSACPVRAFCDARLGTEALEPPVRGIDPRLRGILLHGVLERWLDPAAGGGAPDRITLAIDAAFETLPPGDAGWQRQLEAERRRLEALLEVFGELEAERAPFRVVAVERRTAIELAGLRLDCRIDREDRLESGVTVLLDYKTGKRPVSGWLGDRLSDCQLPLYAQQGQASVGVIAAVTLGADRIEYRAAGACAEALPGRQQNLSDADWQAQLERWRGQLETLIVEFVRGDVRIGSAATALADGAYAALTRVLEAPR